MSDANPRSPNLLSCDLNVDLRFPSARAAIQAYIVQFHPVEGEHGSNEFQIAHLLIDSK
jgi:hypothetical protein